jgi:hypothetical protein
MVDTRLNSAGNVRVRLYPTTAFVNPLWPTVVELNAGLEVTDDLVWEDLDFGMQASEVSDVPPVSAKTSVGTRGAANFGGGMSFYYPGEYNDDGNLASLVYDFLKELRVPCYVAMSVDGEIGEPDQPAADHSFANGDYVSVFGVQTDAWTDMTEGEDEFRFTRNFLKNGTLAFYTVASTTAPVLEATAADTTGAAGDKLIVTATVNGRDYTRGVRWSSSDPTVATVSSNGVISLLATGTATITATLPGTSTATTDAVSVTVS